MTKDTETANNTNEFNDLPTDLITAPEAARLLCVKPTTLATWRTQGNGPDYVRYSRSCYYSRAAVEAFARASMVRPGHNNCNGGQPAATNN